MRVPRVTRLIYVEYLYAFSDWRTAKRTTRTRVRGVSFFTKRLMHRPISFLPAPGVFTRTRIYGKKVSKKIKLAVVSQSSRSFEIRSEIRNVRYVGLEPR